MTFRQLTFIALVFAPLAIGCDLLDPACPTGMWRPRAGEDCVPVPVVDSGVDAGAPDTGVPPSDAGASDAATDDAAVPGDAGDAAVPGDAGASDAAVIDASAVDAG